jgi:hypothetical protein
VTLEDDLDRLCLACGLCCDGTIFAVAPLEPGELSAARALRLPVIADRAFTQPCPLQSGTRCSIHTDPARPAICRTYACRLRKLHASEGGDIEARIALVARTRAIAARVRAKLPPAETSTIKRVDKLIQEGGLASLRGDPELALDVAELAVRLERDFGVVIEREKA